MLRPTRRECAVTLALALCSLGGGALLVSRLIVTGATSFGFLPWNLFLAWIPFAAGKQEIAVPLEGADGRPLVRVFRIERR